MVHKGERVQAGLGEIKQGFLGEVASELFFLSSLCPGVRRRQKGHCGLCRQSFLALLWEPEFPSIQPHPFLAPLPIGPHPPAEGETAEQGNPATQHSG